MILLYKLYFQLLLYFFHRCYSKLFRYIIWYYTNVHVLFSNCLEVLCCLRIRYMYSCLPLNFPWKVFWMWILPGVLSALNLLPDLCVYYLTSFPFYQEQGSSESHSNVQCLHYSYVWHTGPWTCLQVWWYTNDNGIPTMANQTHRISVSDPLNLKECEQTQLWVLNNVLDESSPIISFKWNKTTSWCDIILVILLSCDIVL